MSNDDVSYWQNLPSARDKDSRKEASQICSALAVLELVMHLENHEDKLAAVRKLCKMLAKELAMTRADLHPQLSAKLEAFQKQDDPEAPEWFSQLKANGMSKITNSVCIELLWQSQAPLFFLQLNLDQILCVRVFPKNTQYKLRLLLRLYITVLYLSDWDYYSVDATQKIPTQRQVTRIPGFS